MPPPSCRMPGIGGDALPRTSIRRPACGQTLSLGGATGMGRRRWRAGAVAAGTGRGPAATAIARPCDAIGGRAAPRHDAVGHRAAGGRASVAVVREVATLRGSDRHAVDGGAGGVRGLNGCHDARTRASAGNVTDVTGLCHETEPPNVAMTATRERGGATASVLPALRSRAALRRQHRHGDVAAPRPTTARRASDSRRPAGSGRA